jgi:hypothetical protein
MISLRGRVKDTKDTMVILCVYLEDFGKTNIM